MGNSYLESHKNILPKSIYLCHLSDKCINVPGKCHFDMFLKWNNINWILNLIDNIRWWVKSTIQATALLRIKFWLFKERNVWSSWTERVGHKNKQRTRRKCNTTLYVQHMIYSIYIHMFPTVIWLNFWISFKFVLFWCIHVSSFFIIK